jgi:two-component system CheB/CheR fusion protein
VIPRLLEERDQNDTIRIWVPGCATGEEVYSIAILLQEHMAKTSVSPRVQIFASDIDERALAVARTGRYPEALLDNVSQARRERFFVRDGASYVICKQIRDQCIFSAHSVMRDPPFSRIDLVSCRNLLIYFGPEVQARVLPTFHYALKPDGYLFLGAAENVTQFDELFAPVQKHHRLFRRRSVPTPHLPFTATGAPLASPLQDRPTRRTNAIASEFRQAVDAHVLQHFAPAHVVVNGEGEIVFFSARTGKYLEMPIGTPTRHLLTLARRDIRLDLQTMLREVADTRRPAHRERVAVDMGNGTVQMMSLMAEPFNGKHDAEPLYIVAFNDQGPILSREEAIARLSESQAGASLQTERDLRDTRERLQSLIEEYETALEELKSSNEELVSVNEELQSTNEELEASKEELQSLNEELHTVNAELNGKVDALDRANSDLVNLFQATDVATVFLDKKLVIRSFTPAVSNVLNIRPGDVGRPVTDLSSRVTLDGLSDDIRNVFENGQIVERRAKGGSPMVHYLVRIAPYMDSAMLSEGVVITFLDVTTLVMSEERHHMLVAELQHRTRNMLGMVQAIALRTLTDGTQLESFLERLEAIGRTQSLLGRASTEQLRLSDLLQQELDALPNSAGRVRVSGPDVMLDFESAQTLGLALHELATNAVKHGALGVEGGRIDVSWKTPDSPEGGAIMLEWREHGVEMLAPPERVGFGRELIEKALTHTLQARTQLLFEPDGVVCRIILPSVAQRISATSSPDHAHA